MDLMVAATQDWLWRNYGTFSWFPADFPHKAGLFEDDHPYYGKTGWHTINVLLMALQKEYNIASPVPTFGPSTTRAIDNNPLAPNDDLNNKNAILQGALWCKGYPFSPGHYASENEGGLIDNSFDSKVAAAVIRLKEEMGFHNPDAVVTTPVMKALMSMDAFWLVPGGDRNIRIYQQALNNGYSAYCGIQPTDGYYSRGTNKALIYAIQAEEEMSTSVANGILGPSTRECLPQLPYTGEQKPYKKSTLYSAEKIMRFIELMQMGLYVNGYGDGSTSGVYQEPTIRTVKAFQKQYGLPVTGICDLGTWLSILSSAGDTTRPAVACDTSTCITTEQAQQLVTDGYQIVGRYLTGTRWNAELGISQSKAITRAEADILFTAGLRWFPIMQAGGARLEQFTSEKGATDVREAIRAANHIQLPYGTIIYFAVDFDAQDHQITSHVFPYFQAVVEGMASAMGRYRIGVYGTRNVCTRVCNKGYAVSSFVSDMSTGYSGNMGFKIPDNWAFDQYVGDWIGTPSTPGRLEIDRCGYSGRDTGVNYRGGVTVPPNDNYDYAAPTIRVNRGGTSIAVWSQKVDGVPDGATNGHSKRTGGYKIGEIKPDQFYSFYIPGFDMGGNRWYTGGDCVAKVIIHDDSGNMAWGYIQTYWNPNNLLDASLMNNVQPSLKYQEMFHHFIYSPEDDRLVQPVRSDPSMSYAFTAKQRLPYFSRLGGEQLGTIEPGDRLYLTPRKNSENVWHATSQGGQTYGYLMYFDFLHRANSDDIVPLDPDDSELPGAFVDLGIYYGTLGASRALW